MEAPRHVEERPNELAELLVRRLRQLRREIAAGHRARPRRRGRRPASPRGRRAGPRPPRRPGRRGARKPSHGRGQLRGLGLGRSLLRQQQQREEDGAADSGHAGDRRQGGRELLEGAAGEDAGVGRFARLAQTDRHVARAGHALGEQARRVEVAPRGCGERRLRRVDGEVESDGVREPATAAHRRGDPDARASRPPTAGSRRAPAGRSRAPCAHASSVSCRDRVVIESRRKKVTASSGIMTERTKSATSRPRNVRAPAGSRSPKAPPGAETREPRRSSRRGRRARRPREGGGPP